MKLSKFNGNFEKFDLVIADKRVIISDGDFYKLPDIEYETLELMISRSSYATKEKLVFGPFEILVIQFQYFVKDSKECSIYLAKYVVNLNKNKGELSHKCYDGE